ncbi:electron transfer flavoprotein subunit beta/FixA family protein [Ligilactobacillus sp. LYQ139]|uniref:electron transfer flavoprotein subunit beta/FixA family protein n=1 Tax=Ligilactobacillus sp. LYQ139 TaxID=3378800 RepID=UPI00385528ED
MSIIVCVKGVPVSDHVTIDPQTHHLERTTTAIHLDPADRYALAAAKLLRSTPDEDIITVCMGAPNNERLLRITLAMGATRAILLTDKAFAGADTLATATALTAAIQHCKAVRLVITGTQSTDADTGQVGGNIAAQLGWELLPNITRIVPAEPAVVTSQLGTTATTITLTTQAVLTVGTAATFAPAAMTVAQAAALNPTRQCQTWDSTAIGCAPTTVGQAGSATTVTTLTPVHPTKRSTTTLATDATTAVTQLDTLIQQSREVIK